MHVTGRLENCLMSGDARHQGAVFAAQEWRELIVQGRVATGKECRFVRREKRLVAVDGTEGTADCLEDDAAGGVVPWVETIGEVSVQRTFGNVTHGQAG